MNNRILTIIVTYNGLEWIDRCISSVERSSIHSDVIVIDNLSTDKTVDHIRTHFPNTILFESKENLGFGKGNNVGMRYALEREYDYVYLLNQDAWVEEDTFEKLVSVFRSNEDYGLISPLQLHPDMNHYERLFDKLACRSIYPIMCQDATLGGLRDVYEVGFVQAAHWMISKTCLETVGLFSPVFPHYGEDDNYCQRVRYHGFKIGIVPSAKAVHDADNKPKETRAQRKRRFYVKCILALSSVDVKNNEVVFAVIVESFKDALRFKTLDSILMLVKSLNNYKEIIRCREISKQPGSFIN